MGITANTHRRSGRPTRNRVVPLLRGLIALVALMVLLIGVPIGLWIVGHAWLPTTLPSGEQIWQALTTQDSGALLLGAVVLVGFAAWLIFALSVLLELAARLRHRRAPQLRGLGWAQSIAGLLLTAIVTGLLAGAGASAAPMTVPAAASVVAPGNADHHAARSAAMPAAPPQTVTRTADGHRAYEVRHRDTLWGLSQRWFGGDGTQYRKIVDLNLGRPQPDGGVLRADGQIRTGWILAVPPDADFAEQTTTAAEAAPEAGTEVEVTVRPGDTLSQIALDVLGDASRYPEIFEGNKNRPQTDGRVLTDPDKIYPQWRFTVRAPHGPASQDSVSEPIAPPAAQPRQASPPTEQPRPAEQLPAQQLSPASGQQPAPTATGTEQPVLTTPAPVTPPQSQQAAAAAQPTPAARQPAPAGIEDGGLVTLPTALTVSAILAGVLAGGLVVARRRQHRRRSTGRQVALPSPPAVRVEKAMRAAQGRADITFLDLGLRSLSALLADEGDPQAAALPEVMAAWLGPAGLRLILVSPCPTAPAPFEASPDGTTWFLPATAELPVSEETAANYLAPLPTLASVGRLEQDQLLLDLEGFGALRITGDPAKGTDLLRHLAAELAHNCWSDGLDVLLVGFGDELTALNPDRIRHVPTLPAALRGLRARLAEARRVLEESSAGSVLRGRVNDLDGDAWMPEVLLVACPEEGAEDELVAILGELAAIGRSVVAVVASGVPHEDAPGLSLIIDATGDLRIPDLLDRPLRAEGIPQALVPHVVELFTAAAAADEPIPQATDPASWARDMDASGQLLSATDEDTEPDDDADPPPTQPPPPPGFISTSTTAATATEAEADQDDPALGQPEHAEDESAGGTAGAAGGRLVEFSRRPAAPPEAQQQLARVYGQDPELDADLREWQAEDRVRPKISILGEPVVVAPGIAPAQRVQWYTEVLVYLALNPRGVDPDKLINDLWEGQQVKRVTYRQVMSTARKWAGSDPAGEFFLTHARGEDPYKLREHLLDWSLFRRLRKRAQAHTAAADTATAITHYRAALDLLRGPAFVNLRPGGYAWLANRDQCHDRHLPGFIAETAHELVELTLATGDLELAEWAATTALGTDPYRTEDRPLLDLMRIAHARGDQGALERHARQLIADADVELPEDLPPHTFAVLHELLPRGLRSSLRPGA